MALTFDCLQEQCPGVTSIIDIATLTGACGIALGTRMGGLFASSDAAADAVMAAGKAAGERFWRLPLEEGGYRDMLDSASADMKNYGACMMRSHAHMELAVHLRQLLAEVWILCTLHHINIRHDQLTAACYWEWAPVQHAPQQSSIS